MDHRDVCIPGGGNKQIFGMGTRTSSRIEQWEYYLKFCT
jgi:hypothetical protein